MGIVAVTGLRYPPGGRRARQLVDVRIAEGVSVRIAIKKMNQPFVDLAVAIVVNSIASVGSPRMNRGVGVVTFAGDPVTVTLCANVLETLTPFEFSVEGGEAEAHGVPDRGGLRG